MYRQNFSVRRVPEVVAHSGSALLHFFSDDAYNMSGFNISYKINGCPTIDSGEWLMLKYFSLRERKRDVSQDSVLPVNLESCRCSVCRQMKVLFCSDF